MSDLRWYYVCDDCSSIVTITDAPIPDTERWECADCGSERMSEYTDAELVRQRLGIPA